MRFSIQKVACVFGGLMAALSMPTSLALSATITVPAGGDINAALNRAKSGDTVRLSRGTYEIEGNSLNLKSGVSLVGDGPYPSNPKFQDNYVTIKGKLSGNVLQSITVNRPGHKDMSISRINFDDIRLTVRGSSRENPIRNFTVGRCRFRSTRNDNHSHALLLIYNADRVTAFKCKLLADQPTSEETISGVRLSRSTRSRITGCYARGKLVSAYSSNGCENISVDRNFGEHVGGGFTDHGMYHHTYTDVEISYNKIAGWPDIGPGQSLKLKSGSEARVTNNEFWTSGMVLRNSTPKTLVSGNILHQGRIDSWQPDRVVDGKKVPEDQASTRTENNTMYAGNIVAAIGVDPRKFNQSDRVLGRYSNGNNRPGGVHNNKARDGFSLKEGIFARGNSTSVGRDPNPNPNF